LDTWLDLPLVEQSDLRTLRRTLGRALPPHVGGFVEKPYGVVNNRSIAGCALSGADGIAGIGKRPEDTAIPQRQRLRKGIIPPLEHRFSLLMCGLAATSRLPCNPSPLSPPLLGRLRPRGGNEQMRMQRSGRLQSRRLDILCIPASRCAHEVLYGTVSGWARPGQPFNNVLRRLAQRPELAAFGGDRLVELQVPSHDSDSRLGRRISSRGGR
jgi:hypothetical protein